MRYVYIVTAFALLANAQSGALASVFATHLSATLAAADTPTTSFVLPQLAFGGGWYTAVYFSNTGASSTAVQVQFMGDDGNPLSVPGFGTSTTVNLAGQGTAILEVPNNGPFVEGSVLVSLPSDVVAYGVFRQYSSPPQEAVVPLSPVSAMTSTLIWDDNDQANLTTAVAVVNPSASPVVVGVTVRDDSGQVVGTTSINLPAHGKTATVLRSLPGLSGMKGKRGQADFSVTSGNVAVLGLRFGDSAFTSIPTTQQ